MKNRLVILSCILAMTMMAGCTQTDGSTVDTSEPTSSLKPTIENKAKDDKANIKEVSSEENYYYTLNSELPTIDINKKEDEIKYREPYQNFGTGIITTEEQENINETVDKVQNTEEIPKEADNEIGEPIIEENNINTEGIDTDIVEEIPEEEVPQGPSEEDIKVFEHKKLAYELNYTITYDIYQNGILLLDNINSEDDFNKNHKVTLQIVFKNAQKKLETIENIGITLNNEFSNNKELLESWDSLYNELKKYRDALNIMDTQQEIITNKEKLSSKAFNKLVNNFSGIISKEIGDYKPGIQLTNTVVDIDNTFEVGDSE